MGKPLFSLETGTNIAKLNVVSMAWDNCKPLLTIVGTLPKLFFKEPICAQ